MIRDAEAGDAGEIAEIWNHYITETTISFNSVVKSVDEVAERIETSEAFLVAEGPDGIDGFATWVQFRAGVGYRYSIENTILLRPGEKGRGTGRALIEALCEMAREAGHHSVWAGVSGENPAGVAFHKAVGFEEVAQLKEVGHKFGRWLDLTLMQRLL